MNRLLIFDLKGSIAHFRKFYTSSSSLSYSFPPRTTIIGIIASILGRERDSYYEELNTDNCKVALSIRQPIRKIMQTVNYIRTKEEDGYLSVRAVVNRFIVRQINKYPTPIELIVPLRFMDEIIYRIYFHHQDNAVMNELSSLLNDKKTTYPLYLGLSELLAHTQFVADVSSQNIKEHPAEQVVELVSICNFEHIGELEFSASNIVEIFQYIEEKMPLEFSADREIKSTASFIHEKNQKSIRARLNIPSIEITYSDEEETINEKIIFME